MEQELSSIVQLSEAVFDMVIDMVGRYLPWLSILFAISFLCCMIRLVISADGYSIASSDSVYREKLTEKDIQVINKELRALEEMQHNNPESTHRDKPKPTLTERMLADVPEPAHREEKHVKMVSCKHCLAPKPKGHTCAYCGMG